MIALYHVAGHNDFIVHLVVRDADHLRDLALDAFTSRREVARIETHLIFEHVSKPQLPVLVGGELDRHLRQVVLEGREQRVELARETVAEAVEEGADLRELGGPLAAVHLQQRLALGRAEPAGRPRLSAASASARGRSASRRPPPGPVTRSIIQSRTRTFSPKPGQRNGRRRPVRNQLTWKIAGGLRERCAHLAASGRSSRPCCSRRRAASPSGRGARRRPRRSRRPSSPSPCVAPTKTPCCQSKAS